MPDKIQKKHEPTNNYNSYSSKLIFQDLAFQILDNFLVANYALQFPLSFWILVLKKNPKYIKSLC